MMKEKEIQQLIERFLEGETSNAEEQVLYDYFENKEIAPDLMPYRKMFRWYAAGMTPYALDRPTESKNY